MNIILSTPAMFLIYYVGNLLSLLSVKKGLILCYFISLTILGKLQLRLSFLTCKVEIIMPTSQICYED